MGQRMEEVAPENRVSGMNSHPRMTRYKAMSKVYDAVHKLQVPAELQFSCVNLSYDYDDYDDFCSLTELEATASIITGFLVSYFGSLTTATTRTPAAKTPASKSPATDTKSAAKKAAAKKIAK